MKSIIAAGTALSLALSAMPAAAQDAAHHDAAETTVDYLFPAGTYERMMRGTMEQMTGQMMDSMIDMPMRDLIAGMDLSQEDVAKVGKATMREMMAIIDPHFVERMSIMNSVMMNGMVDVMADMEPAVREGLTDAYAEQYTADELARLNTFFATPLGTKYAANSMTIFMSPKMMAKMQESMPAMIEAMPALIGEVRGATAHLPPPRQLSDLSEEERKKLEELAGAE